MQYLSRDSFARTTLMKESIKTNETCSWCGSKRKDGKLYRYFIEEDRINVRPQMAKGMFCCKSCFNSYNG